MITIRVATVDDVAELAALTLVVHAVHTPHRPDLFVAAPSAVGLEALLLSQLAMPELTFLLAQDAAGRPLGYALAEIAERSGSALILADTVVSLRQIAVDPNAGGGGVGSALLEEVRALGRAAGCRRLVTQVWDFNEDAHAFYRKSGLRPMTSALDQEL
ncbi:N-acetyltransferase family protein [Streptacidiphilus sp. MAP12-33]|uniref:GNAT family N-acetyltransferase n=1 Tax=Streptacidiphilus sp. MAP12-33 TaxID=3156266 RepID=UPI003516BF35